MKPKTVIVLAVLLCIVIGYVIVRHSDLLGPDPSGAGYVFGRRIEGIKTIRVVDGEGAAMAFTRDGDGWRMTEPIPSKANPHALEALVTNLQALTFVRSHDNATDMALTGLDKPLWTVSFTASTGAAYRLEIGKRSPLLGGGQQTYVRAAAPGEVDGPIYIVEPDFDRFLRRPVGDFRDKMLLTLAPERITALTVEGADSFDLRLVDGDWRIKTTRFEAPADGEAVSRILRLYEVIVAEDFVDDAPGDLSRYGLAEGGRLTVTIEQTDPDETVRLMLGAASGQQVFAKLAQQPGVVLVASEMLHRLQPDPKALRDRRITTLSPEAIAEFRLSGSGSDMAFRRGDDGWAMLQPFELPAHNPAANELLVRLMSVRAVDFHDGPVAATTLGLETPLAELHLLATDGQTETIRFARAAGEPERLFALTDEPSPVFALLPYDPALFTPDPVDFCDRTLSELPAGTRVTRLILRRHLDAPDEILTIERNDRGDWTIAEPQPTPANNEIIERLVQQLRHLQAIKIVSLSEVTPEAFEWANQRVTATLVSETDTSDTPRELILQFVKRTQINGPIGTFAWAPQRQPVVVGRVTESLFDDLIADLRSTLFWNIQPDSIRRISLRSGGAAATVLVRTDGTWTLEGDDLADIDPRAVTDYLTGIRLLQAARFVPDSAGRERAFGLDRPWLTVELTAEDGATYRIVVGPRGPEQQHNRYATCDGVEPVIVLPADEIAKLARSVDDFIRK